MEDWAAICARTVPIARLILALDARAGAYRRDMHTKIDAVRETVGDIDTRLAVVEDRSHRVRHGDPERRDDG